MILNKELKRRIIEISFKLGLSHICSCITALDIIKNIYDTKKQDEKFVMTGHAHLAHAVVMEKYGIINNAETNIDEYGIHCERIGGCDVSTGSLGHELSISVGLALANRSKSVVTLITDGSAMEGSLWEALRIACERNLQNLYIHVNHNKFAAYREIDNQDLIYKINTFTGSKLNITHHETNFGLLMPILKESQEAHYVTLDKEKYEYMMEVLR